MAERQTSPFQARPEALANPNPTAESEAGLQRALKLFDETYVGTEFETAAPAEQAEAAPAAAPQEDMLPQGQAPVSALPTPQEQEPDETMSPGLQKALQLFESVLEEQEAPPQVSQMEEIMGQPDNAIFNESALGFVDRAKFAFATTDREQMQFLSTLPGVARVFKNLEGDVFVTLHNGETRPVDPEGMDSGDLADLTRWGVESAVATAVELSILAGAVAAGVPSGGLSIGAGIVGAGAAGGTAATWAGNAMQKLIGINVDPDRDTMSEYMWSATISGIFSGAAAGIAKKLKGWRNTRDLNKAAEAAEGGRLQKELDELEELEGILHSVGLEKDSLTVIDPDGRPIRATLTQFGFNTEEGQMLIQGLQESPANKMLEQMIVEKHWSVYDEVIRVALGTTPESKAGTFAIDEATGAITLTGPSKKQITQTLEAKVAREAENIGGFLARRVDESETRFNFQLKGLGEAKRKEIEEYAKEAIESSLAAAARSGDDNLDNFLTDVDLYFTNNLDKVTLSDARRKNIYKQFVSYASNTFIAEVKSKRRVLPDRIAMQPVRLYQHQNYKTVADKADVLADNIKALNENQLAEERSIFDNFDKLLTSEQTNEAFVPDALEAYVRKLGDKLIASGVLPSSAAGNVENILSYVTRAKKDEFSKMMGFGEGANNFSTRLQENLQTLDAILFQRNQKLSYSDVKALLKPFNILERDVKKSKAETALKIAVGDLAASNRQQRRNFGTNLLHGDLLNNPAPAFLANLKNLEQSIKNWERFKNIFVNDSTSTSTFLRSVIKDKTLGGKDKFKALEAYIDGLSAQGVPEAEAIWQQMGAELFNEALFKASKQGTQTPKFSAFISALNQVEPYVKEAIFKRSGLKLSDVQRFLGVAKKAEEAAGKPLKQEAARGILAELVTAVMPSFYARTHSAFNIYNMVMKAPLDKILTKEGLEELARNGTLHQRTVSRNLLNAMYLAGKKRDVPLLEALDRTVSLRRASEASMREYEREYQADRTQLFRRTGVKDE